MEGPSTKPVLVGGLTLDEWLTLAPDDLDSLLATGPTILRVGTASVLGHARLSQDRLIVELAQIDGGGEGVLLTISVLAERIAAARGLPTVDWIVHALNCAKPNLKLRRVLIRRGFKIEHVEGVGEAYRLRQPVALAEAPLTG